MRRIVATTVPADQAGLSLLDWLARRFRYADRGSWAGFIEEGRLLLNESRAFGFEVLRPGDRVRFLPPEGIEPEVDESYRVISEEEGVLVVDKPAGLPCHPSGRFFRSSLWHLLLRNWEEVHFITRLDRETSGLVLVCTTAADTKRVTELQRSGGITKTYLAMVHGQFPEALDADGFLYPDGASRVRKKRLYVSRGVGDEEAEAAGQSCRTLFRRLRAEGGFSLLEARLLTGRTHQIRATLSSLGYPLVGDKLYGRDEGCFIRFAEGRLSDEDRALLILENQALHCAELSFAARDGSPRRFRSEPRWPFPPARNSG